MENTNNQEITKPMLQAFHEMIDYCYEHKIDDFAEVEHVVDIVPEWVEAFENDELRRALSCYIEANNRNAGEIPNEPDDTDSNDTEDIPFY